MGNVVNFVIIIGPTVDSSLLRVVTFFSVSSCAYDNGVVAIDAVVFEISAVFAVLGSSIDFTFVCIGGTIELEAFGPGLIGITTALGTSKRGIMVPVDSGWGAMGAVANVEDCLGILLAPLVLRRSSDNCTGAWDDSVSADGTNVDFVGGMEPKVDPSML